MLLSLISSLLEHLHGLLLGLGLVRLMVSFQLLLFFFELLLLLQEVLGLLLVLLLLLDLADGPIEDSLGAYLGESCWLLDVLQMDYVAIACCRHQGEQYEILHFIINYNY